MHISITGRLGSGKSTVCKLIKSARGWEIYGTGFIQRKLAEERGLTVLEMNKLMDNNIDFDKMIDDEVTRVSLENEKTVLFDSRMAWHFARNTFSVFVTIDPFVAAERVFNDKGRTGEKYFSVEEANEKLLERSKIEHERFKRIYNVNLFDYSNFDLVIDSTYASPSEIANEIIKCFDNRALSNDENKYIFLCPKAIYPAAADDSRYNGEPTVVLYNNRHILLSGHKRVLDAITKGKTFIEVKYSGADDKPAIDSEQVRIFENAGSFKYRGYSV